MVEVVGKIVLVVFGIASPTVLPGFTSNAVPEAYEADDVAKCCRLTEILLEPTAILTP